VTELEALRMLAEHRELPEFVRGRYLYKTRRDGRVDVFRVTAKRSIYQQTIARDSYGLPVDVRARLAT